MEILMSKYLFDWIRNNTEGSEVVVEFGSMFCDKLSHVGSSVKNKIAIEIHKPYLDNSKYHDCDKILGDFSQFENLINEPYMDCAMFIDTLEHLEKDSAINLMSRVQKKFNKIVLMIPEGNQPQDKDVFNLGADEFQTHRSIWNKGDIEAMGFQTVYVYEKFHPGTDNDRGCIFAVWIKEE